MIDIENLSEQELSELKQKLDDKLKHPICPCCGTRCGKFKTSVPIIKNVPVPLPNLPQWPSFPNSQPPITLGFPSTSGICNCTGACLKPRSQYFDMFGDES